MSDLLRTSIVFHGSALFTFISYYDVLITTSSWQACRHPEHKIHPRTLRVLEFQGVAAGLCLLKFCTTCFADLILVIALKCRAMLPIISSGLHCLFKVFCLFMQISASIFFHFYKKTVRILRLLCIYKSNKMNRHLDSIGFSNPWTWRISLVLYFFLSSIL